MKSKRIISLFLAVLMAMSCLTAGFSAFAQDAETSLSAEDEAVSAVEEAIKDWYDNHRNNIYATKAGTEDAKAAAREAYDKVSAQIKALTDNQKLSIDLPSYTYWMTVVIIDIARNNSADPTKTPTAASRTDLTLNGMSDIEAIMGTVPEEYKAAIKAFEPFTVKIGSYNISSASVDFKKELAQQTLATVISNIQGLSMESLRFADYIYTTTSGDVYMNRTSLSSVAFGTVFYNLATYMYNRTQDLTTAAGKNPSSPSYSTYVQRTGTAAMGYSYNWKAGRTGAEYVAAFNTYCELYQTDVIDIGAAVYDEIFEVLAVYDEFADLKAIGDSIIEIGGKLVSGEDVNVSDIQAVVLRYETLTDSQRAMFDRVTGNSNIKFFPYTVNVYTEETITPELLYTKPSQLNSYSIANLYKKCTDILNDLLLQDFENYVLNADLNNITDEVVKAAQEKYNAMTSEFKGKVSDEVFAKFTEIVKPAIDNNNFSDEIADFTQTAFVRPYNSKVAWTVGGIQSAADKTWSLVANTIVPMISSDIDLSNGLDNVLEENLYTTEIVTKIFELYATLSHDETDVFSGLTLGTVINMIASPSKIAGCLTEDKYSDLAATIKAASNLDELAAIEFKSGDFAFVDGDREGFFDALLAVLRPITTLLAPGAKALVVDVNVKMFDYVTEDGVYVDGVYSRLLPLLEQIGCNDLPDNDEYKANYYKVAAEKGTSVAADEFLRPIINSVITNIIDVVSPDPLNGFIRILPRLGYVIGSDMLDNSLKSAFTQMGVLSGLAASLDLSKEAIDNMITGAPIDLSGLVGTECKIQLNKIDWMKLANCATVDSVESASNSNAYLMLRTGEVESCFSTIYYYVYDVLFANQDNNAAVKTLLNSAVSGSVAGILINFIDWLGKGGKITSYGKYLDYMGTAGSEPIEKPVQSAKVTGLKTTARGGNGERLRIDWNAQSAADYYNIYSEVHGSWQLVAETKDSYYIFDNLVPGWAYNYRVAAVKAGVEGELSDILYTCAACPTMEAPAVYSAGANSIKINWNVVNSHGYVIQWSTDASFNSDVNSLYVTGHDIDNYTINAKGNISSYYVRVRAWRNLNGGLVYGAWSESASVNAGAPDKVTGLITAARGGDGERLKISWNTVINADSYNVYSFVKDEWVLIANTDSSEYIFEDLVPGWAYNFRVSAVLDDIEGEPSDTLYTCAACSGMEAPVLTVTEDNRIKVEWEIVNSHGYVVQYSTDADFEADVISVYIAGHDIDAYIINADAENVFVRVRAWRNFDGGLVYGAWSDSTELN